MKTVLIALLISVCTAGYVEADKLPVNPWNTSRHTVKINKTEEDPRPDVSNSAETPRWVTDRVEAVRRNNARVQAEYDAAENAANSRRQSQTSENNGGILDKLGGFFSDDKKAAAPQSQPSASTDGDFDVPGKELLDGYNNLKGETEKSVRKLKRNLNSLTNINIEKTIDDTLKSLQ